MERMPASEFSNELLAVLASEERLRDWLASLRDALGRRPLSAADALLIGVVLAKSRSVEHVETVLEVERVLKRAIARSVTEPLQSQWSLDGAPCPKAQLRRYNADRRQSRQGMTRGSFALTGTRSSTMMASSWGGSRTIVTIVAFPRARTEIATLVSPSSESRRG